MKNVDRVSIVTPSYEKHAIQYEFMIESLSRYCNDIDNIDFILVTENKNKNLFENIFLRNEIKNFKIISTESILKHFLIKDEPSRFIARVGKFTFQTVKKFGGILAAETDWTIILDSEGIFCKEFSIKEIVKNYSEQKYVFYTKTPPRGGLWERSLAHQVNKNTSDTLQVDATKKWYMEYFHWFYETEKAKDLINNNLGHLFFDYIRDVNKNYNFDLYRYEGRSVDFFENILYYNYLEKYFKNEYTFYDFKEVIKKFLPQDISHRFKLDELPFSLFGNDYLLNILAPNEVHYLSSLFEEFKLPFIRLEPPLFSPEYFPELKKLPYFTATISSHHHVWMNKKIAICISGEFRHVVHRTPEQQVRTIKSFLSGVDCDVYLHGWHNTSEALIIHELKPKKYLFEDQKSFWDLERQIKFREPRLKAGRDHGSLSMFYSIQKSFELIENHEDYDYVVRIRPDVYPDLSLKEILVKISDEGDFIENAIYFPKCYHSKGINDQFAIGNIKSMDRYFKTFDYIKNNIDKLFFNPESILLKNILENAIKPAVIDFPYALMRHLPFRIHEISRVMHDQENVWWSRTDSLPALTDLSQFFRDKLRSMEDSMTGLIPDVLFFPFKVAEYPRGHVWVEVKNDDNNPSKAIAAYFISKQEPHVSHCVINENYVEFIRDFQKHTFIFKEKNCFIFSQWRFVGNSFCNVRKKFPISRVLKDNPLSLDSMAKAWQIYDQMQEDENNGIHVSRPVEKFQSKKISSNIDVESSTLKISLFFLDKIISQRLRNKLHNNPELFFKDAKNPLSKIIGKSFFKERNRKNNI